MVIISFVLVCLFHLIYFSLGALNCSKPLPLSQYLGLRNFYDNTNGKYWCIQSDMRWSFPSNVIESNQSAPCFENWFGVYCGCSNNGSYTVLSLAVSNACASGPVPSSISSLIDLTILDLSNNFLYGPPASTIFLLSNLSVLNLASNFLSGIISNDFYLMKNLTFLSLRNNDFYGTISSNVTLMTKLTTLELWCSSLSGSIPAGIGNLSLLETLNMGGPHFSSTIPHSIGLIADLSYIFLSGGFSGPIPYSFSNLQNMHHWQVSLPMISENCFAFLSSMPKLDCLSIYYSNCSGFIPDILQFINLSYFSVTADHWTGQLPSSISSLSKLTSMYIVSNELTGSIPQDIGLLPLLSQVTVNCPLIGGPLPESLFNSTILFSLSITGNISGSIPLFANNAKSLSYLHFNTPLLSGSLPHQLFSLPHLSSIFFESSILSGSIPSNVGELPNLSTLYFLCSSLTGSLPDNFVSNTLSLVYVSSDFMSGPLPLSLIRSTLLLQIILYMGYMTSSIPSSYFDAFSRMYYVTLGGGLTGSLPSNLELPSVRFNLSNNYLTGPLPSVIFDNFVQELIFSHNLFSHTIPSSIVLPYTAQLYLDSNLFSGSLQDSLFESSEALRELMINNNHFTGELPVLGGNISSLQVLQLQNNFFKGPLAWDYMLLSMSEIQHIDISNNQFTGTIPSRIFHLPYLSVFACASNCFHGSLPESICMANRLENLVMDGLSSNPLCPSNKKQNSNKPFFVKGFLQSTYMEGSIASCIWGINSLETLHISGNGFSGTLPDISSQSLLSDVSLSNNLLSGSIPKSVQSHIFKKQLSLSNNRFSGTLVHDFAIGPSSFSLSLSVNRLSGALPNSFSSSKARSISSLDVLSGNLFGCISSDIPKNDPDARSYVCGSNELNNAEYAWLAVLMGWAILFVMLYIVMLYFDHRENSETVIGKFVSLARRIHNTIMLWEIEVDLIKNSPTFTHTSLFLVTLNHFRFIAGVGFLFIFCFGLCFYLPLKTLFDNKYTDLTFQYGWLFSSAYLKGLVPLCTLSIVICLIMMAFTLSILVHNRNCKMSLKRVVDSSNFLNQASKGNVSGQNDSFCCSWSQFLQKNMKIWFLVAVVQFFNFFVTLTVNGAFVNTVLNRSISSTSIFFFQLTLAFFKVIWNMAFIAHSMSYINLSIPSQMTNRLIMSLINFIISPCLASLFSIKSCFYFIFHAPDEITSTFDALVCMFYSNTQSGLKCAMYNYLSYSTSFLPPFLYSYQCGSEVVKTYTPILIYSYAMSGIIGPILLVGSALLDARFLIWNQALLHVNGKSKMVLLSQHFALMLTFGISYPALAFVIMFTIVMESFIWKLLIGRMRDQSKNLVRTSTVEIVNSLEKINDRYESNPLSPDISTADCATHTQDQTQMELDFDHSFEDTWRGNRSSLILIVTVAALYWSVMLFDISGSELGFRRSFLVMVLFFFGTIIFNIFEIKLFQYFFPIM